MPGPVTDTWHPVPVTSSPGFIPEVSLDRPVWWYLFQSDDFADQVLFSYIYHFMTSETHVPFDMDDGAVDAVDITGFSHGSYLREIKFEILTGFLQFGLEGIVDQNIFEGITALVPPIKYSLTRISIF